jgi:hypothetical protein
MMKQEVKLDLLRVVVCSSLDRSPGADPALPHSSADHDPPASGADGAGFPLTTDEGIVSTGSIVTDNCLSRIFVAAYLLTGSAACAETAMLDSIQGLPLDANIAGRLSWKTVVAAIMRKKSHLPCKVEEPDDAVLGLPVELRRVARLTPNLRQCFVLRILMAMPRLYCAGLLNIEPDQVDATSYVAAQELAKLVRGEEREQRGAFGRHTLLP